jgi:outer membrane protein TolC
MSKYTNDHGQGSFHTAVTNQQIQEQDNSSVDRPDKWWTLFADQQLNSLVEKVLNSNSDLAKATLTLRKAKLEAGISENDKVPSVSFSQDSSYEYDIDDDSSTTSFATNLSLSYELDLWGRVDALADADQWAVISSSADREFIAKT